MDSLEILTIGESARELGISIVTARKLADAGELPTTRTRGGMRICRREDVERVKADRAAALETRSASR